MNDTDNDTQAELAAWELLAEARRERDEARGQLAGIENKMRGELGGHPDSELWGDAGLIAATMRCVDALGEVTDQRDEWKAKYIQQNKDLGCELMDPNGTIWDYAKELQAELDEAREDLKFKGKLCAELTKQLREEQQLHVQTLNERDEAREVAEKAKAYKRVLKQTNAQLKRERDEHRKLADDAMATLREIRAKYDREIEKLREALQFVATDKIANAADMRCRGARALDFCPENEKSPCEGATEIK